MMVTFQFSVYAYTVDLEIFGVKMFSSFALTTKSRKTKIYFNISKYSLLLSDRRKLDAPKIYIIDPKMDTRKFPDLRYAG